MIGLTLVVGCGEDPVEAIIDTDGYTTASSTTSAVTTTSPMTSTSVSTTTVDDTGTDTTTTADDTGSTGGPDGSSSTSDSTAAAEDSSDSTGSSGDDDSTGASTGSTSSTSTSTSGDTGSTGGGSAGSTDSDTEGPGPCGASGNIIFVDVHATGGADGTTWTDAYTSLAAAMQSAGPGDAVWIAEGEYRAEAANAAVVVLESCVSLHGGFVGTEASLEDRPLPLAQTILHGDFADDDDANGLADNAHHVVVANDVEHVILDGLVITAGRATAGGESDHGGGLYASGSDLVLIDVTFTGNVATTRGGGIYAVGSDLTLVEPVFEGNSGSIGGGMHIRQDASVELDAPTFVANTATRQGGALYGFSASVLITHGELESNTVTGVLDTFGGGAITAETAPLTVVDSAFVGNSGRNGGAIWTSGTSPVQIADSTFVGNTAILHGGAVRLDSPGTTTNVVFEGNSAAFGGAIHRQGGIHTLEDVELVNNTASTAGGAMRIVSGPTTMTGVLFDANASDDHGGALSVSSPHAVTIDASVFSNNTALTGGGAVSGQPGSAMATVTLRNTRFANNEATGVSGVGGALYTVHGNVVQTFVVDSCHFEGNSAVTSGGAAHANHRLVVRNSTFRNNAAGTTGGAIHAVRRESYPRISSSTLYENQAGVGGALTLVAGSGGLATIRNMVLWGNGLDVSGVDQANITYTCSEGLLAIGEGNVLAALDPITLGPSGELFLDQGSECVDAGDDASATTDYAELGLDWQLLTTSIEGSLDEPPVDMGVHYAGS